MAEDPALLITKWTPQRWKLWPFSLLKDKPVQLKIVAYLMGLFVLLCCALILKCARQVTEVVRDFAKSFAAVNVFIVVVDGFAFFDNFIKLINHNGHTKNLIMVCFTF